MSGLEYCPTCEGGGVVPSASGWTDVPCLCADLSPNDRVILRGRAATLADWEEQNSRIPDERARLALQQDIDRLERSMIHLVAGCVGPCRGNSAREPRCVLGQPERVA